MKADMPQMKIRLDPGLKKKIEDAKSVSGRSLNAEICFRLEQSFGVEPTSEPDEPDLADKVKDLERRVTALEASLKK